MGAFGFISDAYNRLGQAFGRRDEREFLPAALEVVETPPSPTGRMLGLLIILLFAIGLSWSVLGKVDILATAPGRVMPAGDVKTIQSLDPGVVRAIDVQDGDHVRAGQRLIALDPTQTGADRDRIAHDLMQARLDVARLGALAASLETGRPPALSPPPGAPPDLVRQARLAMLAQAGHLSASEADIDQQIAQKSAEADEVAARSDEISAALPLLSEKERIHRELTEQGYGTSLAYLDAQQAVSQARHEIQVESQRRAQALAARGALARERDSVRSQYATDLMTDLRKAQEQVSELSQELVKAENKASETDIRSPIDGVVEQLAVHTLHGVVSPAQALMIVVPDTRDLTVEAHLANRDVGFVHPGQPVKVKVETFSFTRYGLINGRVLSVSRDVVSEPPRSAAPQAETTAAPGAPAPPSYVARVALERTDMLIDGRREPLVPGMAVTAEIRTGERTVISYLLSPLARKTDESLHER